MHYSRYNSLKNPRVPFCDWSINEKNKQKRHGGHITPWWYLVIYLNFFFSVNFQHNTCFFILLNQDN